MSGAVFQPGEVLYEHGARDAPFYILESGRVPFIDRKPGKDVYIAEAGSHAFIGQIDGSTGKQADQRVRRRRADQHDPFDRRTLRDMVPAWPEFGERVFRTLMGSASMARDRGAWMARLSVTETMGRRAPGRHMPGAAHRRQLTAVASGAHGPAAERSRPPSARRVQALSQRIPANFRRPPRTAPATSRSATTSRCRCHAERLPHMRPWHSRATPLVDQPLPRPHGKTPWRQRSRPRQRLDLHGLTERAKQLAAGLALSGAQLQSGGRRIVARPGRRGELSLTAIDTVSTGIPEAPGPTPWPLNPGTWSCGSGRLAYHNQHWTPARAHASRDIQSTSTPRRRGVR